MNQWQEIRADFPGTAGRAYLNAAATSLTPRPVRDAVASFYRDLETSGDASWSAWIDRRARVRAAVARFVGAEPPEIAFVPNTSTGMNLIVDLLERDGPVLSDEIEFPAVTLPWVHRGIPVHFLPAENGVVSARSFAREKAPPAGVIAISHVQFSNGCRVDLGEFGRIRDGRRLVVSGSQSVGVFPVDVHASGVDALACAGHKWLCAGYGAGFCFIGRDLLAARPPRAVGWMSGEEPYAFDNRSIRLLPGNARTELGCPAFGGIFALGAAVEYLAGIGIGRIAERVLALNTHLTSVLEQAGFVVLSPAGDHRSGETLVAVDDPAAAQAFLAEREVHVTRKPQGLRISTHFYNDESDVEACVHALVAWRARTAAGRARP